MAIQETLLKSKDVFPLIENVFAQGILPEELNLWHTYYLLALDTDKYYPCEFTREDAQEAVNWAKHKGLSHECLLEWYSEYVRQQAPPPAQRTENQVASTRI